MTVLITLEDLLPDPNVTTHLPIKQNYYDPDRLPYATDPLTSAATPLPPWLSSFDPKDQNSVVTTLEKYPRTKAHLEIEKITFESVFETILDEIVEGRGASTYIKADPRNVNYGRFMKWIQADKDRRMRYEEAQEIATEAILEKMDEIAAGTESPEDIERSKLRLAQYKFKVQAWNKRRYGGEKEVAQPFGVGGVTINITAVESPYTTEKLVGNVIEALPNG